MKYNKYLLLGVLATFIAFAACKKDNGEGKTEEPEIEQPANPEISSRWKATSATVTVKSSEKPSDALMIQTAAEKFINDFLEKSDICIDFYNDGTVKISAVDEEQIKDLDLKRFEKITYSDSKSTVEITGIMADKEKENLTVTLKKVNGELQYTIDILEDIDQIAGSLANFIDLGSIEKAEVVVHITKYSTSI